VSRPRLEIADVFRQYEKEFFAKWGSHLTAQQRKVFRDICACRTAACGARLEQCDHCSEQTLRFNSCGNRHCPRCQSSARDRWLTKMARDLLNVPYCHVVFTLPGQLIPLALQNARLIYNLLFQAASEALLTIAADPKRMGARVGFLAVLHTWNQKLNLHPHLHCLVPAGGLSGDQSRWIHSPKRFFLPVRVLGSRFRKQFLALLGQAWRGRKLRLSGLITHLQNGAAFDRLVSQLKRLKWVVYAKRPFGGPEYVLKYLARYTHRVAISSGRLISSEEGQVSFRWRDSADGNQQKVMTLEAVEFIRRFLQHALPSGFVKIRHFGFLANPCRKRALLLARTLLPVGPTPEVSLTPAQCNAVERRCPACGVGSLCVLGWLPPRIALLISSGVNSP
jgi:Putative transposase/Transposase zinc-binding domain